MDMTYAVGYFTISKQAHVELDNCHILFLIKFMYASVNISYIEDN